MSASYRHIARLFSKSRALTVACFAALLLFASCGGAEDTPAGTVRFRNGNNVAFDNQGQFLEIRSQGGWTINVSYPDETRWCSVAKEHGAGDDVVWVSYGINSSETSRRATFTVDFGGKSESLQLLQRGSGSSGGILDDWLEMPASTSDATKLQVTHYVPDRGKMRNYSILYDTENHVPVWVAYPQHTIYTKRDSGRTNAWQYDPKVPVSVQPDLHYYFSGYDRGHMLPSASRYLAGTNEQTFYFTNMTPQRNGFNGYLWANMEYLVRGWQGSGSDTLYVVTGAVLRTAGGNETVKYAYTNNDTGHTMPVAVPNFYYKALLKLSIVNGQAAYKAIAFWFPHKDADRPVRADDAISVRELERKTGINFFANLDSQTQNKVETQLNPSEWGL